MTVSASTLRTSSLLSRQRLGPSAGIRGPVTAPCIPANSMASSLLPLPSPALPLREVTEVRAFCASAAAAAVVTSSSGVMEPLFQALTSSVALSAIVLHSSSLRRRAATAPPAITPVDPAPPEPAAAGVSATLLAADAAAQPHADSRLGPGSVSAPTEHTLRRTSLRSLLFPEHPIVLPLAFSSLALAALVLHPRCSDTALRAAAAVALTLRLLQWSPAGRDRPKAPLIVRALNVTAAAVVATAAASPAATLLLAALLSVPQLARKVFAADWALGPDAANRLRIGGGPMVLLLAVLAALQCGSAATVGFAAATGLATWLAPDEGWPPPWLTERCARAWWRLGRLWSGMAVWEVVAVQGRRGRPKASFLHARLMVLGSGCLLAALAQELGRVKGPV